MVFPVAIGGGLRVFPEDRGKVEWCGSRTCAGFDSGVVLLVHRPGPGSRVSSRSSVALVVVVLGHGGLVCCSSTSGYSSASALAAADRRRPPGRGGELLVEGVGLGDGVAGRGLHVVGEPGAPRGDGSGCCSGGRRRGLPARSSAALLPVSRRSGRRPSSCPARPPRRDTVVVGRGGGDPHVTDRHPACTIGAMDGARRITSTRRCGSRRARPGPQRRPC